MLICRTICRFKFQPKEDLDPVIGYLLKKQLSIKAAFQTARRRSQHLGCQTGTVHLTPA